MPDRRYRPVTRAFTYDPTAAGSHGSAFTCDMNALVPFACALRTFASCVAHCGVYTLPSHFQLEPGPQRPKSSRAPLTSESSSTSMVWSCSA